MKHVSSNRCVVGRSAVESHGRWRRYWCAAFTVTAVALIGCAGEGRTDRADERRDAPSRVSSVDGSSTATTTTLPPTTTSKQRAEEASSSGPTSAAGLDLGAIVTAVLDDAKGGVVALVVRDGDVVTAAAGERNAEGDPMTAATPSRVRSISKTFIATMVLQLVDEGRVNLDERLATYLPDTPVGADVTIRDLLRHHSGVPNYTDTTAFVSDVLADRSHQFVPADLLNYIADVAALPAGERFAYSNTNYILLGQLIEHLDGVDLNSALQTRISGPLDLPNTQLVLDDGSAVPGLAAGWSRDVVDGGPVSPYVSIASSAWAAGALVSTTNELATFLTALFAGDLITDESLTAMTDGGPYGYGLGLFEERFAPDPARHGHGHSGGMPGYLSFMVIEPTSRDIVVVLTNNDRLDIDAVSDRSATPGRPPRRQHRTETAGKCRRRPNVSTLRPIVRSRAATEQSERWRGPTVARTEHTRPGKPDSCCQQSRTPDSRCPEARQFVHSPRPDTAGNSAGPTRDLTPDDMPRCAPFIAGADGRAWEFRGRRWAADRRGVWSELGDCRRFTRSLQAVRHIGLDVTVDASDRRRAGGYLTRQGPATLRWALFEAGMCASRPGSPDHAYYTTVKQRHDGKLAAISVARQLARRCYHTLRHLDPQVVYAIPA